MEKINEDSLVQKVNALFSSKIKSAKLALGTVAMAAGFGYGAPSAQAAQANSETYHILNTTPTNVRPQDNDTDDGGASPATLIAAGPSSDPSKCGISMGSGDVMLNPIAGKIGPVTFDYTIAGSPNATATDTVNLHDPNNAPNGPAPINRTVNFNTDTVLNLPALGWSDADGNAIRWHSFATQQGDGSYLTGNGRFWISGENLTYRPNASFTGNDSFMPNVTDDGDYGIPGNAYYPSVLLSLDVQNLPPTADNVVASGLEDRLIPIKLTASADTTRRFVMAPMPNPATQGRIYQTPDGAVKGTEIVAPGTEITNTDRYIMFEPAANVNGTISGFFWEANDGVSNSALAQYGVDMTPVNDGPTFNITDLNPRSHTVVGSAPNWIINVQAGPANEAGQTTTVVINPSNPAAFTQAPSVDAAGNLNWQFANNWSGPVNCQVSVQDNGGVANLGVDTSAIQNFTLTRPNGPPVATNDNYMTQQDTMLKMLSPGVTANDPDMDGDMVTAILTSPPANGSVILDPQGGFEYQPNAGFFGTDSFKYKNNDGMTDSLNEATVSINVNQTMLPAVAVDDIVDMNEDEIATIDVLGNDVPPTGDVLTLDSVVQPANGTAVIFNKKVIYTPRADLNGKDQFIYTAKDKKGNAVTGKVDINVAPVNDAPVGVDHAYELDEGTEVVIPAADGLLVGASDVDGDKNLEAVLDSNLPGLDVTLYNDGSLRINGKTTKEGVYDITFKVSDGTAMSAPYTTTLRFVHVEEPVTPPVDPTVPVVDLPPVAGMLTGETTEDQPLSLDLLMGATDPEGKPLRVVGFDDPANGGTLNWKDELTGTVTYTPPLEKNFVGEDTFNAVLTDGVNTVRRPIKVVVGDTPKEVLDSTPTATDLVTDTIVQETTVAAVAKKWITAVPSEYAYLLGLPLKDKNYPLAGIGAWRPRQAVDQKGGLFSLLAADTDKGNPFLLVTGSGNHYMIVPDTNQAYGVSFNLMPKISFGMGDDYFTDSRALRGVKTTFDKRDIGYALSRYYAERISESPLDRSFGNVKWFLPENGTVISEKRYQLEATTKLSFKKDVVLESVFSDGDGLLPIWQMDGSFINQYGRELTSIDTGSAEYQMKNIARELGVPLETEGTVTAKCKPLRGQMEKPSIAINFGSGKIQRRRREDGFGPESFWSGVEGGNSIGNPVPVYNKDPVSSTGMYVIVTKVADGEYRLTGGYRVDSKDGVCKIPRGTMYTVPIGVSAKRQK
jgi:hypothetical protein